MDLFCFASSSLTNIWAGIGAGLWAVAETSASDMKVRISKSHRMTVGSIGILYCNETHSFTTPFLVYSKPHPDRMVADVWAERWRLPFRIHAFGNPTRQLHKDTARSKWPVLKDATNVPAAMNLAGTTVFVPKEISAEDRALILTDLAI